MPSERAMERARATAHIHERAMERTCKTLMESPVRFHTGACNELTRLIANLWDAARAEGLEEARKIARRGSDVPRGWLDPNSRDERTDALLYSALREGQEIEKAIRALKDKP